MGFQVTGQTGPHPLYTAADQQRGNYGRNTAFNMEWYSRQNPQGAPSFTQVYSPDGQVKLTNAFGYCEETIRIFDTNQSKTLGIDEVRGALGLSSKTALELYRAQEQLLLSRGERAMPGTPEYKRQSQSMYQGAVAGADAVDGYAQKFMKAVDADGNQQIDAPELTAFTLFTDDATQLLPTTAADLEKAKLFPPGTGQLVMDQVNAIRASVQEAPQLPGANGVITPAESKTAEMAVQNMPNTAQLFVQELIKTLDLRKRHQDFQQGSGSAPLNVKG